MEEQHFTDEALWEHRHDWLFQYAATLPQPDEVRESSV